MSNGANLSIMGLYNYDPTVLDMMVFPDGFTDAQKQNVKDNILVECAELEFLYPAPEVAKTIIGIWSRKELPYWNRVYKASLAEYDPIENYRRNETETISDGRTEEHSGSDALARTGSDTNSESGSEQKRLTGSDISKASGSDTTTGNSTTTDQESGTDTVTNKITGFDSNTLVTHDSSETAYGHKNTNTSNGSNTQSYGRTDTITHDTAETTTFGKNNTLNHNSTDTMKHGEKIEHAGESSRSLLAFGNIGTMTSQDMLTQELEIAKIIEVVPIIIESFKNRFCLMVY